MKNMSFFLTQKQFDNRTKTVTRRNGWIRNAMNEQEVRDGWLAVITNLEKVFQHILKEAMAYKEKELEQLRLGVELLEKAVQNYEVTNNTLTAKLKEVCEAAEEIKACHIQFTHFTALKTVVESAQPLLTKGS